MLGIGNLAVSREAHQELFDVGAIARLLPCIKSNDVLTRRAVAFALNNVSANPSNHTACERLGIIRTLVGLLKETDKDTNLQAVLSIRHLCESARCRNQLIDVQGIAPLLSLCGSEDIEVKRECAAALRNLSLSEQSKVAIVRDGGLDVLCDMMHSPGKP